MKPQLRGQVQDNVSYPADLLGDLFRVRPVKEGQHSEMLPSSKTGDDRD